MKVASIQESYFNRRPPECSSSGQASKATPHYDHAMCQHSPDDRYNELEAYRTNHVVFLWEVERIVLMRCVSHPFMFSYRMYAIHSLLPDASAFQMC